MCVDRDVSDRNRLTISINAVEMFANITHTYGYTRLNMYYTYCRFQ